MTLFSLNEQKVMLEPGKKIIPQEAFSTLVSAADLVEKAREQALEYRKETAIELEKLKEIGFQEGFQKGLEEFNSLLLSLNQELSQIRSDLQKKLLPLAMKFARKIIGEELRLHPDQILSIVTQALKSVVQHKRVIIYVHRSEIGVLEKYRAKIKKIFEHLEEFSIQESEDIEPGGCMIKTEAGIINAQLENQWRALETAIQQFEES